MPRGDDCVACRAVFLPNHELATVPAGQRIVFDPGHRRVWRICTACDTWNLLGPEAAALALPELEVRFRAGVKSGVAAEAVAATLSGGTELLRIGVVSPTDLREAAAAKRRRQIERRTLWTTAVGLGWLAWMARDWVVKASDKVEQLPAILVITGMIQIAATGIELRHGQPARRGLLLGIGMFLAGWTLIGLSDPQWLLGVPPTAALALIAARWASPITELRVALASGARIDFTTYNLPNVALQWGAEGSTFTLRGLPDDHVLVGDDATQCLRELLKHHNYAFERQSEEAFALLRSLGGLRGLLRAIEGFRGEGSADVHLFQLPATYLLALDLALATDEAGTSIASGALAQHKEASNVAAIAEMLDAKRS